ncbi:MAG: ferritin-like domain-containing protein [Tepidisphaeraceae bacterium]
MSDFDALKACDSSRRKFLATMSAAGLGLAASNLFGMTRTQPTTPAKPNTIGPSNGLTPSVAPTSSHFKFKDAQADFPGIPGGTINAIVLNYALTLEILEADLYRQALNAASGLDLSTGLASSSRNYKLAVDTGGLSKGDAAAGYLYLREFAFVEAAHRDFLRTAIQASGFTPTTPNPNGYAFPSGPGTTLKAILSNILPLEEEGTRAYLGALPYLTDLNLGVAAGGIYSTECRHSAAISYILGLDPGPRKMPGDLAITPKQPSENTFQYALAPATVINTVTAYFK